MLQSCCSDACWDLPAKPHVGASLRRGECVVIGHTKSERDFAYRILDTVCRLHLWAWRPSDRLASDALLQAPEPADSVQEEQDQGWRCCTLLVVAMVTRVRLGSERVVSHRR